LVLVPGGVAEQPPGGENGPGSGRMLQVFAGFPSKRAGKWPCQGQAGCTEQKTMRFGAAV